MKRYIGVAVLITLLLLALGVCFYNSKVSAQGGQATFVGVDKCKTCHPSEYKDFSGRKFEKSWKVLKMRAKDKDPECLKCHVTGYGQPGGFVSEQATPHLLYKQCESCHGPGSMHATNPGDVTVREGMSSYVRDKDVCIQCHVCMKAHKELAF